MLSKNAHGIGVYVHLNCPHVQEKYRSEEMKQYVDYLEIFFKNSSARSWIRENSSLVHDYSAYKNELELLFVLDEH